MKTKTSILIIGLVTIAAIATGTVLGFSLTSEKPVNKNTLTPSTLFVSVDDANSTITVHQGDKLNLTLQDYGDGGYTWIITQIDTTYLQQVDHFNWGSSGMLGDFGKDTWIFNTLQTGSTTLQLQCVRSFDANDICQRFAITVEIV
jgi:predicted secreted protein